MDDLDGLGPEATLRLRAIKGNREEACGSIRKEGRPNGHFQPGKKNLRGNDNRSQPFNPTVISEQERNEIPSFRPRKSRPLKKNDRITSLGKKRN